MLPVDPPPVHRAVTLRRSQILVDDRRNVRNFGKAIDPKDPETLKLVELIKRDGQLKAVTVVHIEESGGRCYVLDTGFRRMCAMDLLEFDEIKCEVIVGSDDESETHRIARVVGENEGHKPLTPAELAYAAVQIRAAAKDEATPITTARIAHLIGRSEHYTTELLYAYDNLIPEILAAWKGAGAMRLPADQAFRFAHMGKPKQKDEWEKLVKADGATIVGKGRGRKAHKPGAPRPSPRHEVEVLAERARTLVSVWIDGRYEPVRGRKELRIVRAAVAATLAHVLDRDSALPFKRKGAP